MVIPRGPLLVLLGACVCLGPVTPAGAVVRYVNGGAAPGGDGLSWATAHDSLSTALAAAQLGDQIWVAAGRYVGNFTLAMGVGLYGGFAGTETELAQRDWTANPTILDGNRTGAVVTSPAATTASTRIDGFTITNGSGMVSSWSTYGGGLVLINSSPTIANNTITGNSAPSRGGGLYLARSAPTIINNTISGNVVTGNSLDYGRGGGLYLYSSSPTIASNTITGNVVTGNNLDYGRGGGLYLDSSSPTIANNTITGNGADLGGGLSLSNSSSATIANSTITDNAAGYGGAVYLDYSSPTIANTIVAFNSSGIYRYNASETPTLRYNCVYGNNAYHYSGLSDPTGTDGNISADPRLADSRYGNTHIQPDSPCVDAGNNADASGDLDMDGQARIQPLGGIVDIGADESDSTVWPAGPYAIVRVSPAGDDANNGSSWLLGKRTVQAGMDAASALGGEVWVQAGTYQELITLHPYAYVYGGFAGDESARDQRDWVANVTTLDGRHQGSVVTVQAGQGVSAIDGFTITNGSGTVSSSRTYGGGLHLRNCSPTIANNTITGNSASDGSGLYLRNAFAMIAKNTMTGNSTPYEGGADLSSSSPTKANNTIARNIVHGGGGLFLHDSRATVVNNTITGNISLYGGGLNLYFSSPTIANNTIKGNSASYQGGGLYLHSSHPMMANNSITDNSAATLGGGLYLSFYSSPTIANNTITGNIARVRGGGLYLTLQR